MAFSRFVGKIVDNSKRDSLSARLRRRRFELFVELVDSLPTPVRILDLGGVQRFWEVMGFVERDPANYTVTLVNLSKPDISRPMFLALGGDATNLTEIGDAEFDVVFSNSVIEHVGGYNQQRRMANEVQRVASSYFVQTPNYYFPIEPHFLFPGFQWLPVAVRAWLINHMSLGWVDRIPDKEAARRHVEQIRLLRRHELLDLFPHGNLYQERVLGLTKSFVVYGGFDA